jgi:prepilin-type N-terminal cleavage/methylation domain-containing protein
VENPGYAKQSGTSRCEGHRLIFSLNVAGHLVRKSNGRPDIQIGCRIKGEIMLRKLREDRKNDAGFTLIELLIVIVILGILAAVVVFAVNGLSDRGKTAACQADKTTTQVAVEAYYAKNTAYPATLTILTAAPDKFLNSVPATVTYTVGTPATSYTLVGAGGCP